MNAEEIMEQKLANNPSVVFYDSVCVMCDSFIQFLIKIDKDRILRFSSLQSDLWEKTKKDFDKKWPEGGTVVFWNNGKWYSESDAVLQIFQVVGKYKVWVWVLRIIPVFFRNLMYRWIARNRYKVFGKKNSCEWVPADKRYLFLDNTKE
ncbi:thiol-disulfide oxidoreductase DCC family protein [Membranihabitans maritimus]|uniref:thiol-disulfide oxidoreductase DCC family protein n=1 Tax=Membranihabitans maritimus TaxID=2904244 RepID=UPI001F4265D3|nr:DCC1-like thiol-disulfide oxidoreductase family protein [Membranihabitans maritimus]